MQHRYVHVNVDAHVCFLGTRIGLDEGVCMYIYIYMYTHVYIYIYGERNIAAGTGINI